MCNKNNNNKFYVNYHEEKIMWSKGLNNSPL